MESHEIKMKRYLELASPQLLDDKWRELSFDLASSHNVLEDCIMPESASGYVYRDAKSVGSASHNRFLYWRTSNDVLELVELSTEVTLEDNQVRIRFVNAPIVNGIYVIEFSESIAIVLATVTSVHRLFLPHPKMTNRSVLSNLTSDVLFDPANYYLLTNHCSITANQPICASSWFDRSIVKCALSFPDSSILIVQFGCQTHHITTSEIKQTGIIGRLWSKMPNLWAKTPDECENAIFASVPFHHHESNDVLLITLCRDCRIRIFSTTTKECVCSFNMISQSSFHQSFAAHANPSTEIPMLRMLRSYIIVYLPEIKPEFVLLKHCYSEDNHELEECLTIPAADWVKLIDFTVTDKKIWALADMCETDSVISYSDISTVLDGTHDYTGDNEYPWHFVSQPDIAEPPTKSLVEEIFWRNNFSVATVQKALVGIAGPFIPKKNNMEALEELASTRIVNDDQDSAWRRFYEYCLQNHSNANKMIGIVASQDESIVSIVKRSNPSFICPSSTNTDIIYQEGPYGGTEFNEHSRDLIETLNQISNELLQDDLGTFLEERLNESPSDALSHLDDVAKLLFSRKKDFSPRGINLNKASTLSAIDHICKELDLTQQSIAFNEAILKEKMRCEHNPLASSSGIILTFEFFRRLVRARMNIARDLLVYICMLCKHSTSETNLSAFCEELYTSGRVKLILDSLRSYVVLVWLSESPVRINSPQINFQVVEHVSKHFQFFKKAKRTSSEYQSILEQVLHQNLLMNFLSEGGVDFHWSVSQMNSNQQALSGSFYLTETSLNLCKLLWPQSNHLCLMEYLFTHHLDEHLIKYLNLTQEWVECCLADRQFISAANYMLQNRASQAVDIFNRLWMSVTRGNLLWRFLELEDRDSRERIAINSTLINLYYSKLIQLFQTYNNRQCLVVLINNCMSLLEENSDDDQVQSMNSLRAKLFQYYLELEDPDEAYHTMVLTSDPSLRVNCLRKFIVSHCEKDQWINLLSYPFIDIKQDFIEILNQKAESLDLSTLDSREFYKTTYYDLLFASYVMDEDYKLAAEVMYNYSQRLAQEAPGITSIRKQADCLLIALNALRSLEEGERFIEIGRHSTDGRTSILKRSYDCESNNSPKADECDGGRTTYLPDAKISCETVEKQYELTMARIKLLEKDQTTNAIALSPLRPEELINHLVDSSLYTNAMDLSLLFRAPMEPILDGLAAKYILVMRLSSVDMAIYQDIERGLTDLFTNSYSNIDTYSYIANSTSPLIDRLWRLIDHYLMTQDGVGHKITSGDQLASTTTVLMRVVATKLLSTGHDVPASLRRLYMQRNPSELLKLMLKYDKLFDAVELATEMIDRVLEPAGCFSMVTPVGKLERPPVYLPTHLILMLISYLEEDATDTKQLKLASSLTDRLNKFRSFVKAG